MTITKEEAIKIEERLFQEICSCKITMQYIDKMFAPENRYLLDKAAGYFSDLYIIKINYLTSKLLRLFDSARTRKYENFSLKAINEKFPHLKFKTCDLNIPEELKKYRDKYLSHLDYTNNDRADFITYPEIKKYLDQCIELLYDHLDKIRENNGKKSELVRNIISTKYSAFHEILHCGTFLSSHKLEPKYQEIVDDSRQWSLKKQTASKT